MIRENYTRGDKFKFERFVKESTINLTKLTNIDFDKPLTLSILPTLILNINPNR
jgi:hypothetical protein